MPMQFIVLPKNQKCIGCHDLSKFAYFILFDEYTDSRVGYFTAKREFHIIPENSRKWQFLRRFRIFIFFVKLVDCKNSIGVQSLMVTPIKLWRFKWSGIGIVVDK